MTHLIPQLPNHMLSPLLHCPPTAGFSVSRSELHSALTPLEAIIVLLTGLGVGHALGESQAQTERRLIAFPNQAHDPRPPAPLPTGSQDPAGLAAGEHGPMGPSLGVRLHSLQEVPRKGSWALLR